MKNHLTFISIALSITPFAFWKMEKPCCQETLIRQNRCREENIRFINAKNYKPHEEYDNYLFIYNEETGYTIACVAPYPEDAIQLKKCAQFFAGKVELAFTTQNPIRTCFVREETYMGLKKLCSIPTKHLLQEDIKIMHGTAIGYSKKYFKKLPKITPKKQFKTADNVLINNINSTVKISKNNKSLEFKQALLGYFNKNKSLSNIGEKEKALLNNSLISHVFGVIKNNQNSVIWGFAKDKRTGERFHWITEADFSKLIN